jgi:hypothetical protein
MRAAARKVDDLRIAATRRAPEVAADPGSADDAP